MGLRFVCACLLLAGQGVAQAPASSPLLEAVFEDQTDLALQLLQDGAKASQKNRYGIAALTLACQNGNEELIAALLAAGADANTQRPGQETVLMTAARTGKPGAVRRLLKAGADVDARDRKGQDALMWAAAEGHVAVGEALIEAGADPAREHNSGFSPLFLATRAGHNPFIEMLVARGVDPLALTTKGKGGGSNLPAKSSALRIAVENAHFETADLLLRLGADPNDQRSGFAPLHILTWVRKPHRGDNILGMPPPRGSGRMNSLQFAQRLIDTYKADVNLPLSKGHSGLSTKSTPFLLACRRADLPYMQLLHAAGAKLSQGDHSGTTPLGVLCGIGSKTPEEEAGTEDEALAALDWLLPKLELPAALNHVDRDGESLLHGVAYRNWPRLAARLDIAGTDPVIWTQKNKHGWTPLLIAQGYRPGNFKPCAETIVAIEAIMRARQLPIPAPPPPR